MIPNMKAISSDGAGAPGPHGFPGSLRERLTSPAQRILRLARAFSQWAERSGGSVPEFDMREKKWSSRAWYGLLALALCAAYFPTITHVFAIHNDHDHLLYKSHGLLYHEAPHLVSIARPIAAIFSNLPLLFLHDVQDILFYRIVSLGSLVLLGWQFMYIATRYLAIDVAMAFFCALAVFLMPPLYYSVMNASAYVPHLVTIALAAASFLYLSKSDVALVFAMSRAEASGDGAGFLKALKQCFLSKNLTLFFVLFQLAMFCYPPNALIILAFPVARCLFGGMTPYYRIIFALRDLALIGLGLVAFMVLTKAVYFPALEAMSLIHAFPHGGAGAEYAYQFVDDPWNVLHRLAEVTVVATDLWFVPQMSWHIVFFTLLGAALVSLLARGYVSRPAAVEVPARISGIAAPTPTLNWKLFLCYMGIAAVVFAMSGAPIILSYGGMVTYRTLVAPTAIAAVVFVYAALLCAQAVAPLLRTGARPWLPLAPLALGSLAVIAIVAHQQMITITLAKREYQYIAQHVRQALAQGSDAIVMIDTRKTFFPQEIPITSDRDGKPTVPYELGCFSTVCFSTYGIFATALRELGLPMSRLKADIMRGEEYSGVACPMFRGDAASRDDLQQLPPALGRRVARLRETKASVYCFRYDLAAWHGY